LKPTNIVSGRLARVHREPPGPERWKIEAEHFKVSPTLWQNNGDKQPKEISDEGENNRNTR